MIVLTTGGGGFLGTYVVKALKDQGHEPIIFDRPNDVRSSVDLMDVGPVDAVIHLAGRLGTAELFSGFDQAVDVNIKGTQRVLDFCRHVGAGYVGITMPEVWANVYQATKRCARILATAWHESYKVPVSHVCAFNAFGIGQKHGPGHPQKIIPTFASRAWAGEPITIWGDGTQTVDLISAAEVAKVLVAALDFGGDEVFDAGTGGEWTVNEVAKYVLKVTGSSSEVVHYPMREGERPHTRLKAFGMGWDQLGWHPVFDLTELDDTILSYRR
jgi:UDP-glucose 4-epimerase